MLLNRSVTFVGGKGGVGKTTLAAAASFLRADRGERVLLVSTDPAHSTSDILEEELDETPRPIAPGLWAMEIDPERERDRYIADVKTRIAESTSPSLLAEVERQIDLAAVSPGAEEAALFDRFTRILESRGGYDAVVFDTAPTGQTLRLLSLPELLTAWMNALVGRRRQLSRLREMWYRVAGDEAPQAPPRDRVLAALEARLARFRNARTLVTDPGQSAFVFVVVPERLSVTETQKAVATLTKHGIPIGGILINRVTPPAADGSFLARRRAQEAEYLAQIEELFGQLPRQRIPLLEGDLVGAPALRRVAAILAAG